MVACSWYFLRVSGLSSYRRKRITKEARVINAKERAFKEKVGFDQMGDGDDDVHKHDEEFEGWRGTSDWVRRQAMEVGGMGRASEVGHKHDGHDVGVEEVVGSDEAELDRNWDDDHSNNSPRSK